MIGSVRARLTTSVVTVVGAITVVTALVAPPWVERSLIDDRLDGEVAAERAALGDVAVEMPPEQDDPTVGGTPSPELTAIFGPEIADLAASLEAVDALDRLRAFRDDGKVLVAPAPGVLGEIGADGRVRVAERSASATDGAIVTGSRLQSLSDQLTPRSILDSPFDIFAEDGSLDDLLAGLDERFGDGLGDRLDLGELGRFGRELLSDDLVRELLEDRIDGLPALVDPAASMPSADELVFGTREVSGVEVIVAASPEGLDLTIDRLRTALWAAVPFVMVLTGLITWLLAGRALRPVRAITERTGRIRAGTLHERVPVPAADDEIAGLATEMNDMLDRLQREDRRRRQFVADASHELRSPIASIQTQAEVAISETGDGPVAELAGGVLAEALRLGTIVDDLLALAKHDEALAPPGALVDLDDIVLAAAARPRRVPVDTARVSAGQVRGHADQLGRAVTHLLDNAARHANRSIRVSLTGAGGRVVLTVDDDGPGIAPGDRERVFERFVRLDEARVRDDGGAGLGLAVVAAVVSAAGGIVSVEASELGGACFRIDLPAGT